MDPCTVIIGGGPAGATAGRLLASWGHRVLILHKPADRLRGLAESLPPSTRKLLAEIGTLRLLENAGFYRSTGNTVYWGSRDRRVETFGSARGPGFQVFRPVLDRLLLESAAAAGAAIRSNAAVRAVHLEAGGSRVDFERDGQSDSVSCRFVLDCSGRAGVIGRRFRRPGHRTYALVGAWRTADRWDLPDQTHTLVEASDNGWVWSVPMSATTRHVGVMLEGVSRLADTYHAEIARTTAHARLVGRATLQRVWACDASTYSAEVCAGPQFLLVGDAGSFIDPLSSFGVKKALASAWMAAIVVNTCITHPDRQRSALDFFTEWEQSICDTHARRSRDFAREAYANHRSRFWSIRANAPAPDIEPHTNALPAREELQSSESMALEALRESAELNLTMTAGARLEKRPILRGREIVLEDAFTGGIRFRDNVDLVQLAEMACRHRQVPDLFEAYCLRNGPTPLPSVLGGLSLLVARGILSLSACGPCGGVAPREINQSRNASRC